MSLKKTKMWLLKSALKRILHAYVLNVLFSFKCDKSGHSKIEEYDKKSVVKKQIKNLKVEMEQFVFPPAYFAES